MATTFSRRRVSTQHQPLADAQGLRVRDARRCAQRSAAASPGQPADHADARIASTLMIRTRGSGSEPVPRGVQRQQPVAGPAPGHARLLVVEPSEAPHHVAPGLRQHGYIVSLTSRINEALRRLSDEKFDLLILDDGLRDSFEFQPLCQIRSVSEVLVIVVGVSGDLRHTLRAFDLGADDYVPKPASPLELARRVRALLRRRDSGRRAQPQPSAPHDLRVQPRSRLAFVDEQPVDLTAAEFSLLTLLLEWRGEVLTPDLIAQSIWGYETLGERNFVEKHVSRLRAKLRGAGAEDVIQTVRGVGYVIRE